ncbi:MAG: hypothetical protein ACREKL_10235 [Chthoniobacterales bacterium]
MKKLHLLATASLLFLPLSAHAAKSNEVVVEINTGKGVTPITLVRKGDGFVGPRGEYYPTFPTKKTLTAVYGNSASATPTPAPKPTPGAVTGELKVVTVEGGVNIRRDGKLLSQIRTKFPDVRGWKFRRENAEIVVKSGVGREPGFVELFDVRTGKRLDKISAKQIKDGKPAWAKDFAE